MRLQKSVMLLVSGVACLSQTHSCPPALNPDFITEEQRMFIKLLKRSLGTTTCVCRTVPFNACPETPRLSLPHIITSDAHIPSSVVVPFLSTRMLAILVLVAPRLSHPAHHTSTHACAAAGTVGAIFWGHWGGGR